MEIKTPAKVNITLDITGKRADGYHDVLMIMQEIPVYDYITIEKGDGIILSCNSKFIPVNEKNLAYKAASAFFEYTKINAGANINLKKNIPVGAGLGGGSGNAAGVILALNEIYNANLSKEQCMEIGAGIGADVPFFMMGKTCLAEGIGEKLTVLNPMPNCYMVLVKPKFSISTKWVYSNLNLNDINKRPDTKTAISALQDGDLYRVASNMVNVLETVVAPKYPEIMHLKRTMLNFGALGSMMSGSGSAVFGIFDDKESAEECYKNMNESAWCLKI